MARGSSCVVGPGIVRRQCPMDEMRVATDRSRGARQPGGRAYERITLTERRADHAFSRSHPNRPPPWWALRADIARCGDEAAEKRRT